jgi:hypothetical protein
MKRFLPGLMLLALLSGCAPKPYTAEFFAMEFLKGTRCWWT